MIHYHGTPLSGDKLAAVRGLKGRHAFISIADCSHLEIAAEVCQSFAFDNGAFTSWKKGVPFDIEKYAEIIQHWYKHPSFDFYVIPDVIDGSTEENTKMLATWSKLVNGDVWRLGAPVWHLHESPDLLRQYCMTYPRVCLGSSGQYSQPGSSQWWSRMAEAMDAATDSEGYPLCKLHGLRMLDPTIFSHLPLSSADSTNVARNIGIDSAWRGTYIPQSREARAAIMMERIESHASASRWAGSGVGATPNLELFG